jgi:sterol desaturase/sphingolipid hydroxylase (fatty acid hydroxylase superfamily)
MNITELLTFFVDKVYTYYILDYQLIVDGVVSAMLLAAGVLLIELVFVGWRQSGIRNIFFKPCKSTVTDIIYFFLYASGFILLGAALLSLGVPFFLKKYILSLGIMNIGSQLPHWAHMACYLVLLDFFSYWQHRLMHGNRAFWEIHKFHHSATLFNTITVFREHPLDKAIGTIISVIPAFILGVPVHDYIVFLTLYGSIGYFQHSNLNVDFGWFGKYVIQSPQDHRIHHSSKKEHFDRNFATVFPVWDHLFGTYYRGQDREVVLGLPNNKYNVQGTIADTVNTQIYFIKNIYNRLK